MSHGYFEVCKLGLDRRHKGGQKDPERSFKVDLKNEAVRSLLLCK